MILGNMHFSHTPGTGHIRVIAKSTILRAPKWAFGMGAGLASPVLIFDRQVARSHWYSSRASSKPFASSGSPGLRQVWKSPPQEVSDISKLATALPRQRRSDRLSSALPSLCHSLSKNPYESYACSTLSHFGVHPITSLNTKHSGL